MWICSNDIAQLPRVKTIGNFKYLGESKQQFEVVIFAVD
jgi:hypothetical protein